MRRVGVRLVLAFTFAACGNGQVTEPTSIPTTTATTVSTDSTPQTGPPPTAAPSVPEDPMGVLVFHATAGFRHDSIGAGIDALSDLARREGFEATATDDPAVFTGPGLADYRVIVFLNTTGDILDPDQQRAMEEFIRSGNGFVGIHSAADTEYDWDWYGGLVGTYFDSHPQPQPATINVTDASHPAMPDSPASFERFDEWYNFRAPPAGEVTILATLDEGSYEGGTMGQPHPIIWAHDYDGGRSYYTGFGHTSESFSEPLFLDQLAAALTWAAG